MGAENLGRAANQMAIGISGVQVDASNVPAFVSVVGWVGVCRLVVGVGHF